MTELDKFINRVDALGKRPYDCVAVEGGRVETALFAKAAVELRILRSIHGATLDESRLTALEQLACHVLRETVKPWGKLHEAQ